MIETTATFGDFTVTQTKEKTAVVYHADCMDGFASAYVCYQQFGKTANYFPAKYGESNLALLHLTGYDHVYIVDFSYPRKELNAIAENNKHVIVLDHHKTAMEELTTIHYPAGDSEKGPVNRIRHPDLLANIIAEFDMSRAGVAMTWDWFNADLGNRPYWIELIHMRDLWNHKKKEFKVEWEHQCETFHAGLSSVNRDFEEWDEMFRLNHSHGQLGINIQMLKNDGEAILRFQKQTVNSICSKMRMTNTHFGMVPIVNCNGMFASDVGNLLCKGFPYSISYSITEKGMVAVSLRSDQEDKNAADVSEIAKHYGGGGHKNAAGFSMGVLEFFSRLCKESK